MARSLANDLETSKQHPDLWSRKPVGVSTHTFKINLAGMMPAMSPFPFITPMLAMPCPDAFDGENWLFEIKHDGFRLLDSLFDMSHHTGDSIELDLE